MNRVGEETCGLLDASNSFSVFARHPISAKMRHTLGHAEVAHESHDFWEIPARRTVGMFVQEESPRLCLQSVEFDCEPHVPYSFFPMVHPTFLVPLSTC